MRCANSNPMSKYVHGWFSICHISMLLNVMKNWFSYFLSVFWPNCFYEELGTKLCWHILIRFIIVIFHWKRRLLNKKNLYIIYINWSMVTYPNLICIYIYIYICISSLVLIDVISLFVVLVTDDKNLVRVMELRRWREKQSYCFKLNTDKKINR